MIISLSLRINLTHGRSLYESQKSLDLPPLIYTRYFQIQIRIAMLIYVSSHYDSFVGRTWPIIGYRKIPWKKRRERAQVLRLITGERRL